MHPQRGFAGEDPSHRVAGQQAGEAPCGLEERGEEFRILLLSDHKTLTSTRGHDGDPVPFLLYDSTHPLTGGQVYDEDHGMAGVDGGAGCELLSYLFGQKAL